MIWHRRWRRGVCARWITKSNDLMMGEGRGERGEGKVRMRTSTMSWCKRCEIPCLYLWGQISIDHHAAKSDKAQMPQVANRTGCNWEQRFVQGPSLSLGQGRFYTLLSPSLQTYIEGDVVMYGEINTLQQSFTKIKNRGYCLRTVLLIFHFTSTWEVWATLLPPRDSKPPGFLHQENTQQALVYISTNHVRENIQIQKFGKCLW